jgi:hypothetical protein
MLKAQFSVEVFLVNVIIAGHGGAVDSKFLVCPGA